MNNKLIKTIILIVLIVAAFVGLWFWYQSRLDAQLATARAELEASQQQMDEAIKLADTYRLQAEVTDKLLEKVKADEEKKRTELLSELQEKDLELVNIKAEAESITAEYESKLEEFNNYTPSEVADNIQNTLQSINTSSTFSLTEANLFIANEPAARTIGISLQERSKFNSLYSNCLIENTVLNEEIATVRSMADSYATELSYTQQSADEWKQSSLAEKAAREQAENQIQKQDAVINQLNRKLWWKKIEGPIYGLAGATTGYLIARGLDRN